MTNAAEPQGLFRLPYAENLEDMVQIEPDTGIVRVLANKAPLVNPTRYRIP